MEVARFDVFLVILDPTIGSEIRKTRPCVIISPDEMNRHLRTVIVAPMTTARRSYPSRVEIHFQERRGQIVVDQLRPIDKTRLARRLGTLSADEADAVLQVLHELFAP